MPLFNDTGSGGTNFFPVLILSLLKDASNKSAVFSEEDNFSESTAMGPEWNNESNDQEDGNRGATWTNSTTHLECFKTHCDFILFGN